MPTDALAIPIYEIDPLRDSRWAEFLKSNPSASLFHSCEWLEALRRTYGYRPVVFTTSDPNDVLINGLVFCRVESWLTGRRLVSVPFSDHCEPLANSIEDLNLLLRGIEERAKLEGRRYVEIRPRSFLPTTQPHWRTDECFYHHRLDLRPGADAVYCAFHHNCIQRRIRHAERVGVTITEGSCAAHLREFYDLVVTTRRRQGLPPQPMSWFRNLMVCLGESATIHCAYKDGRAVAGILMIQHEQTLYYKYSASLVEFHKFGAVPYLLWHAIRDAIRRGLQELDLGRSDCGNLGLVTFKDRWNAKRVVMSYLRFPHDAPSDISHTWLHRLSQTTCGYMPERCLAALGRLAYRHIG